MIEEARDRLIDKGIPASKISVLPNTVDVEKFLNTPIDQEAIRHLKPYFVISYVGHINNDHRGVHTVLEAMALIKDEAPDLHFVGAGAVREQYFEKLQGLVHQYGLMDKVTFTGWLDETGFATYIAASDICVCPHLENEHTHTTFPNKIYLYNLFKKPVITGSCDPMKRYVRDSMGGEHFESGNAKALADLILKFYHNTDYRRSLGEQGHLAVMQKYNWQASAPTLLGMYHQLVDEKLTVGAVQV